MQGQWLNNVAELQMRRWVQFVFLLLAAGTAFGSNGLVSAVAPEAAYNAYGGAIERLEQRLPDFYGGSGQSAAYQVTYGTLSAATVVIGGEFGHAGRVGRTAVWTAQSKLAVEAANPVPTTMARVIPEGIPATTLGRPGAVDVYVTAAEDIAGLNAEQIARRLGIPQSPTGFRVIAFPTPEVGVASPVFRSDPGFVGGGRTSGGAREFVIPNQPIPENATIRIVR